MPANVASGETPFPVRGTPGGWVDWWERDSIDDLLALAAARLQVATSEAVTQRIAAELQREEKHEQRQQEHARHQRSQTDDGARSGPRCSRPIGSVRCC